MRIGIDARELTGGTTGVGRYLHGLLREWLPGGRAVAHELLLYAHDAVSLPAGGGLQSTVRLVAGTGGSWWEQVSLPNAAASDELDVFFAPAYTAPLRLAVPTVLTIHDLSYMAHPEWFRPREGIRRRLLTRHAARRAHAVITVSQFSRGEILAWLGLDPERVHVIPQGIDPPKIEPAAGSEPRILYVGSIFNRRHVPDLIRAFDGLLAAHPSTTLDIVGDNRTYPHEDIAWLIEERGLTGRARYHQYASADRLAELYAQARAFVFLSEYEGLGTTPLEGLAAGVPPVVGDTPVARETLGDAALYVPCGDRAATMRAVETVLFDEAARQRLLAAAPATLAKYSWTRAAHQTLEVIEAAARSADRHGEAR